MTIAPSLYEEVLAAAAGRPLAPPRAARDSAAVVLWRRDDGGEVEVYWQRRGRTLPFMGGWYAFPGGGLERSDASLPVVGTPLGTDETTCTAHEPRGLDGRASRPTSPDLVPGLAAAALRELFEETGVLLARSDESRALALPPDGAPLAERLATAGSALDAARLRFAGRWLTPPLGPVRFDNRFFLVAWAPADGEPSWFAPESEAGEWIRPAAALARWRRAEVLAAPPVLHLLRVLADEGPDGDGRRLLDTAEADLGPLRRIEFVPGAIVFPLRAATLPPASHTNTFLLGFGDCALVDPGSPFDEENDRLLAALAAAERELGRRVTAIWLTHHHPDHVAGVARLREALGVPVLSHRATAERLATRGLAVDATFDGGTTIVLAGEPPLAVELLHTPGHARGHLAFRLVATDAVVAGDLLSGLGTVVIDPPEGDMDEYLDSLARVEALAPTLLLPSHGAPLAGGAAHLAELRRHRLERERQVLAAWDGGLREVEALVPVVYPDVAPMLHPLAGRQVRAHLERLARRGTIEHPHRAGDR